MVSGAMETVPLVVATIHLVTTTEIPPHQTNQSQLPVLPTPYVEWSGYTWYVVLGPSGRNDTPRMVAASERLTAVGGGVMRMKRGQFTVFEED